MNKWMNEWMCDQMKVFSEVLRMRMIFAKLSSQAPGPCPPPRAQKRQKGWVRRRSPRRRLLYKYKVLLFLFLWVLLLPSGEGEADVNMANFLLDSRHILNYRATFYFKLTNKEISHPPPSHIFLGRLMLPPFCSGWILSLRAELGVR